MIVQIRRAGDYADTTLWSLVEKHDDYRHKQAEW